jgi:hypothetical protein
MRRGIPRRWLPCGVGYRGGGASPWGGADRGGAATERRGTSPRPTARIWLRVVLYGIMYRFHTQNADSSVHTRSDARSNMQTRTRARTRTQARRDTRTRDHSNTRSQRHTHAAAPPPQTRPRPRPQRMQRMRGASSGVPAARRRGPTTTSTDRARHTLDLRWRRSIDGHANQPTRRSTQASTQTSAQASTQTSTQTSMRRSIGSAATDGADQTHSDYIPPCRTTRHRRKPQRRRSPHSRALAQRSVLRVLT